MSGKDHSVRYSPAQKRHLRPSGGHFQVGQDLVHHRFFTAVGFVFLTSVTLAQNAWCQTGRRGTSRYGLIPENVAAAVQRVPRARQIWLGLVAAIG